MTASLTHVAIMALTYRTLWRNCYSGSESLFDDLSHYSDGCDGIASTGAPNVSLLGMLASQELDEVDWALVDLMPQHEGDERVDLRRFGRAMAGFDLVRCEAWLHALPDDPRELLTGQEWARLFFKRWDFIEAVMLELEPLTWDREEMDEIVLAVCGVMGPWNDPSAEDDA
jgi:hypothetical protein